MNVIFHVASAVGIVAAVSNTNKIETAKQSVVPAISAFVVGVFIHGMLDYMPHQYPLSAVVDCLISLFIIIVLTIFSDKKYRLIVFSAFIGSIFPDILDLLSSMMEKYLGLDFLTHKKIFPWHYPEYSGSIFNNDANLVSDINHFAVVLIVLVVCGWRRYDLKRIFKR